MEHPVEGFTVEYSEMEAQSQVRQQRRRPARVPTRLSSATVRRLGPQGGQARAVRVMDISPGGLSFESASQLQRGQRLRLRIDTPVRTDISALGEVRYTIPWGAVFRVGVEFIDIAPSDRRLLQQPHFLAALLKRRRPQG
jgi:c-di-GMP-binding flagellar brake protein YcgR